MSIVSRFKRMNQLLPQMNWAERFLFVIAELIQRHQRRFGVKNVWGNYMAKSPCYPYFPYPVEQNRKREIVVVMGFGHSGSGAVLDLLSEYSKCTTLYYKDAAFSLNKSEGFHEIDILRNPGGLFALEHSLSCGHERIKDAAIKSFLNLCAWLHLQVGGIYNTHFLELTRSFLDAIILKRIPAPSTAFGAWGKCSNLCVLGTDGDRLIYGSDSDNGAIYLLKKLTVCEYRQLARRYISGILDGIPSCELLVLDQFLQDSFCDISRYQDYIGPFKAIYSIRDPRDVYVTWRRHYPLLIPKDPEAFAYWYAEERGVRRCIELSHKDSLVIRFEELVKNYDDTVRRIEQHVGLEPEHHVHAHEYFKPEVSCVNVGSWRTFDDQKIIGEIARLLPEFCYPGV